MIPDEVVIRHSCHCRHAAVQAGEGEPEEHLFTVDGEQFPWIMTERGPLVSRLMDDLYSIDVEIILIAKDTYAPVRFDYTGPDSGVPYVPVLDGRPFPWALANTGYEFKYGDKILPTLHLVFLAKHVSGNLPVKDMRRTNA